MLKPRTIHFNQLNDNKPTHITHEDIVKGITTSADYNITKKDSTRRRFELSNKSEQVAD